MGVPRSHRAIWKPWVELRVKGGGDMGPVIEPSVFNINFAFRLQNEGQANRVKDCVNMRQLRGRRDPVSISINSKSGEGVVIYSADVQGQLDIFLALAEQRAHFSICAQGDDDESKNVVGDLNPVVDPPIFNIDFAFRLQDREQANKVRDRVDMRQLLGRRKSVNFSINSKPKESAVIYSTDVQGQLDIFLALNELQMDFSTCNIPHI